MPGLDPASMLAIAALSTLLILFSTAVVFAAERVIGLSQAFK